MKRRYTQYQENGLLFYMTSILHVEMQSTAKNIESTKKDSHISIAHVLSVFF